MSKRTMPTARTRNDKGEWVPAKPISRKRYRHWDWAQRIVDRLWKVKT